MKKKIFLSNKQKNKLFVSKQYNNFQKPEVHINNVGRIHTSFINTDYNNGT